MMFKDYTPQPALRRTIQLLLQHARALDTIPAQVPLIREAAAARAGQLLGIAYQLHDVLVAIPAANTMYDLRQHYVHPRSIKRRPSSLRGRW